MGSEPPPNPGRFSSRPGDGAKGNLRYRARRTLHTGTGLLAGKQHVEFETTWDIYQRMVTAYREPDRRLAKSILYSVIEWPTSGIPTPLVELRRLGRTLRQRVLTAWLSSTAPGP